MQDKYWWFILGILTGWVVKIPFMIKWYRELKGTSEYKEWKDRKRIEKILDAMERVDNFKSYSHEQN
jgi:hypothetical protein